MADPIALAAIILLLVGLALVITSGFVPIFKPAPTSAPIPAQRLTVFGHPSIIKHQKTIKWLLIAGLIVTGVGLISALMAGQTALHTLLCILTATLMWVGPALLLTADILLWTRVKKQIHITNTGQALPLNLVGTILILAAVILVTIRIDGTCFWNKQIMAAFGRPYAIEDSGELTNSLVGGM